MSDPVKVLHPRKLYTMLAACPTASARAAAALEFVRGCTVARGGFLFLARDGQLVLAASGRESEPSAGLVEEVARVWKHKKRTPGSDQTTIGVSGSMHRLRASDDQALWTSATGESFEHRLLAVDRAGRWSPVGIAMLQLPVGGALLPMRHVHVAALCNALLDAGDVIASEVEQPA